MKFYGLFGMERYPTFNVADSSVVVGGILLLVSFVGAELRANRRGHAVNKKANTAVFILVATVFNLPADGDPADRLVRGGLVAVRRLVEPPGRPDRLSDHRRNRS